MVSISLCMIVKNEEDVLARALDSVKELADEIIIVDTGSEDRTKDIARRYTQKVFDFEWEDDFAAARNFACRKASMDYWMWLDADDIVTENELKKMKALKSEIDPDTDVVMMKYLTGFDRDGYPAVSYYRERWLRNGKGFIWKGRVHEAVVPSGKVLYSDIEIEHHKNSADGSDRNLRIYESMIARGELGDPRQVFYYGRELYDHGRYEEAISVFDRFLAEKGAWRENLIDACLQRSLCFKYLAKPQMRLDSLFYSFRYDLPRAEICCEIGACFMECNDHETASYWYERALAAPDCAKYGGFDHSDCRGYIPLMQLCVCYDRLGDHGRAWQYHLRAAMIRPASKEVIENQKYFERLFVTGRYQEA